MAARVEEESVRHDEDAHGEEKEDHRYPEESAVVHALPVGPLGLAPVQVGAAVVFLDPFEVFPFKVVVHGAGGQGRRRNGQPPAAKVAFPRTET
jgi:hypothetical protein